MSNTKDCPSGLWYPIESNVSGFTAPERVPLESILELTYTRPRFANLRNLLLPVMVYMRYATAERSAVDAESEKDVLFVASTTLSIEPSDCFLKNGLRERKEFK
jgi:hypothetical protein